MNYNFKKITASVILFLLLYYVCSSLYLYHFDITPPHLEIHGIENQKYYNGNINLRINITDEYKVKNIQVQIDDKIIFNNQNINSKKYEVPILIPSIHLDNGLHKMTIKTTDAAKKENQKTAVIEFGVDNEPLDVTPCTNTEIKINQGCVLHIQLKSNKLIKNGFVKTLQYQCPLVLESQNGTIYESYIPISTEEIPGKYLAQVFLEDNVGNTASFEYEYEILAVSFKKQYIKLKNKKSENFTEDDIFEEKFNKEIEKCTQSSPQKKLWTGSFYRPCLPCALSTDFGVIRTSFERGRYRHDAVDFAAPPKSPVWACQSGILVIKESNHPTYGNVVIIDHGIGLLSIYGHLETFSPIEVGTYIKKGQVLGTVGMTGYASGYHLHWELRLCNIKINPLQWIKNDLQ
jgi:murein DD-endopeptidase MepM/ murein hydrolase activator NlpD